MERNTDPRAGNSSEVPWAGDVVTPVDKCLPARYGLVPYERPILALGEELNVRIDPLDLKSVVFLCADDKPDQEGVTRFPRGTAFSVKVKSETDPSVSWDYLVTARHIIDDDTHPDLIWVRINRKDGMGFHDERTERRQWHVHHAL